MARKTREKDSHIIEEARRVDRWRTFQDIAYLLPRNVADEILVIDFLDIIIVLDGSLVFTNAFNNPVEPVASFVTFDDNAIVFKNNVIVDNNFLDRSSVVVAFDDDDVTVAVAVIDVVAVADDDILFHDLARANIPIQRIILDDTLPIGRRAALHEEPHLLLDLSWSLQSGSFLPDPCFFSFSLLFFLFLSL